MDFEKKNGQSFFALSTRSGFSGVFENKLWLLVVMLCGCDCVCK